MGDSRRRSKKLGIQMNLDRINININGNPSPPLSDAREKITVLEDQLGAKLPHDYITLLSKHDGGHPEVGCFNTKENNSEGFEIAWFYAFSNPKIENIFTAYAKWFPELGKSALPIGRDGGGNQIYFDFGEAPPSIWIFLHDGNMKRLRVADNLGEFIDSLYIDPDFI